MKDWPGWTSGDMMETTYRMTMKWPMPSRYLVSGDMSGYAELCAVREQLWAQWKGLA